MILKLTGAAYDDRAKAWTDREYDNSTPVEVRFGTGFIGCVLADLAADFGAPEDTDDE